MLLLRCAFFRKAAREVFEIGVVRDLVNCFGDTASNLLDLTFFKEVVEGLFEFGCLGCLFHIGDILAVPHLPCRALQLFNAYHRLHPVIQQVW